MDTIGTFEAKDAPDPSSRPGGSRRADHNHSSRHPDRAACPCEARQFAADPRDDRQAEVLQQWPDARWPESEGLDQRRSPVSGSLSTHPSHSLRALMTRPRTQTRALLDRLENEHGEVPSLWHLELANALALATVTGASRPGAYLRIHRPHRGLPIVVDEQTPNRALSAVLELVRSERLSAYDASYLELAMRRGAPLATKARSTRSAARPAA